MSQPQKVIHLPKVRMLSRGGRSAGSSIKITNVKSIRPPDPNIVKKQEEERLRAQLQKEIVSRSRTCANRAYECPLSVLSGYAYCGRHILNDPNAPYKQCSHVFSNGQRCVQPAPAESRDARDLGQCFEHARASLYARQRSAAPPPPVTTTETLLNQLQHYVKPERVRTTSCASSVSVVSEPAEPDQVTPHAVDPFKQIDGTAVNAATSTAIMECASASDSDCDSVTVGPEGDCRDCSPSDTEDAPCESLPLWRAGVYTAEEAVSEGQTALRNLQAAYRRQMSRLRSLLHTARLNYVRSVKQEKEHYCSINAQARGGPLTVRERRQLRKLKAYAGYRRRHAADAVLARKLHRKRAKVNEITHRPMPIQNRCNFVEGGVRCPTAALPAAKHCLKHILNDPYQVLFSKCGDTRGGVPCREPFARLPLGAPLCRYHSRPPHYTTFAIKKDDSESGSNRSSSSEAEENMEEPMEEERLDLVECLPEDLQYE